MIKPTPHGEPMAWMTFTEEGDPDMVFLDRLEACQYCEDDDPPKPLYLATPPTVQALECGAEPPGIQALMCVISSLRDIAHFSDEEGGELMSALCALRDWAHAQPAPATQQAGEMEVFVLQWPGEDRINLSTVFDTETEALEYMQNRCDTPGIRLVRFSSKAAHGPADGESK